MEKEQGAVRHTLDVASRTWTHGLAIVIPCGGSGSALPAAAGWSVPSRAVCSCLRFVTRVSYAERGGAGGTRGRL
jgi:hypothetical protein